MACHVALNNQGRWREHCEVLVGAQDGKGGVGEAGGLDIYICLIRREGKGTVTANRMKNTQNLRPTRTKMESLQLEPTSKIKQI